MSNRTWSRNCVNLISKPFGGRLANAQGMSLIEIIIVIALIGTIMTIIVSKLTSTQDEAMKDATRIAMNKVEQSLQLFRVHNHRYPTSDQGLKALVSNPGNAKDWRGPYIEEEKLKDAWRQDYGYESDGRNYTITSPGPDGSIGSEDDIRMPETKGKEGGGN